MLYDCHRLAHTTSRGAGETAGVITGLLDEATRIGSDIADRLDEVLDGGGGSTAPASPGGQTMPSVSDILTSFVLNQMLPVEGHGKAQPSGSVHLDNPETTPESGGE
jgi:hypothetical protein